ncbi:MAG: hypothetical protein RMJ98_16650 [Myxococcales bacterium]|nr:hypothetical protein [Polyangiaceae bacterium]MDW8250926.1 hypothetical protein [Myxococcales bacterium]
MVTPRVPSRVLEITSLAIGGDGVAHTEFQGVQRAVFLPQVAPGERVEAQIDFSTSPARGEVVAVLSPSPFRRPPPCLHADRCGGCPWMFLNEEGQRRAKESLLTATVLRALGDRAPREVMLHEASLHERYRTRARLAFSGKRSLTVGYRKPRSHQIVQVERCLVLIPPLNSVLARLETWLEGSRGEGEILLALGQGGKPVLELRWTRGEPAASLFLALERAVSEGELAGASVLSEGARSPAVVGDPTAWTEGADGAPLEAPAFAQAHPEVAAQMGKHLRRLVGQGRPSVVELFAGAGTFTVMLAQGNLVYTAVDESRASCKAARRNLARRGLGHVRVQEANGMTWKIPSRTSLVLLDPPRSGARPVAEALANSSVAEILYISCDLATLARDLSILVAGRYNVLSLHGFDLFPQTSHLEVIAHLRRH